MLRRVLPNLGILAFGLVAMLWGLGSLQRIFIDEREQARAQVHASRNLLQEYARRTLEQRLEAQLHEATPEISLARRNWLMATNHLFLVESGRRVLPHSVTYAGGTGTPAQALYEALRSPRPQLDVEPGSPWAERLAKFDAFKAAVDSGTDADVESAFREILTHRAFYVIRAELDLPYEIALLDLFAAKSHPHPDLVTGLLRDGLGDGQIEGLQSALLRRRDRFSFEDFQFLAAQVLALSNQAEVDADDFQARAFDTARQRPSAPNTIEGPSLIAGGTWYARPDGIDRVIGVAVEVNELLVAIEEEMHARALLAPTDALVQPEPSSQPVSLEALPIGVTSPRFAQALAASEDRFWLKTAFTALSAVLALGIVVLALVVQTRKQRFLELKSDFVATVSHELRTPLASVRLMAETLERRTAGLRAARDYPTRIVREIDELSFLVENILSFNRLDKGRWKPRTELVSLREIIDEVESDLPRFSGRDTHIRVEGIDGVVLRGDPELLKLLLGNLAKNACVYNERTPVTISFRGCTTRRWWRLEVSDNGVGIEAPAQRRVFADFYRAKGVGARGSGLGLAICRKTMEAHGGKIRVGSSSPKGTTFELDFPANLRVDD